jgi:hypothetical protein
LGEVLQSFFELRPALAECNYNIRTAKLALAQNKHLAKTI